MKLSLVFLFLFSVSAWAYNIPILTLNHEVGTRYEIENFEEEDFDYLTYDGYTFNKGYSQIQENFTKALAFKFKFYYNIKNYDHATNLNNKAFTYYPYFSLKIVKNMKLNLGFKFGTKHYLLDTTKDLEGLYPNIEFRYNPIKYLHLGFRYGLMSTTYLRNDGDYVGNRGSLWYEQRIVPQVNFRMRYRIENRDYRVETSQRKDSFKHSFAATIKIDLNK